MFSTIKFAILSVVFLHIIVLTSQFPEEGVVKRLKKDNTGPLLEGDGENSGVVDMDHGSPEQDQLVEDETGQDEGEVGRDEGKADEDYDGAGEEQMEDGLEGDIIISDRGGHRRRRPHHGYQPYYPPHRPEVVTVVRDCKDLGRRCDRSSRCCSETCSGGICA